MVVHFLTFDKLNFYDCLHIKFRAYYSLTYFNSHFNYMSCIRHGDHQWKRNPNQRTEEQTNQPLVSMSLFPSEDWFLQEHLLLNSTIHWYITSYLTQSSLELLLFHYRPPVMVLYNRLQSHCHLSRCRCNRTSHHDQYRCYMKYMQQGQFYWMFWFTA